MFDRYLEAGGNFLDCADVYQFGDSERLLGEFVAGQRDDLVIATKYTGGAARHGTLAGTGNSRKNLIRSLEASLQRLGTDYVDLFWVHYADGMTPVEEIIRAFDDVVRAGKALYVGFSDFAAWRIARAATVAELRGWAPVVAVQVEYSLAERSVERELLPMAEGLGMAALLWSPLGGGLLTGKYAHSGTDGRLNRGGGPVRQPGPRETTIIQAVSRVAAETSASPAQVAIAWVRQKTAGARTAHVPILGARTLAQLEDNLGALALTLSADEMRRLDEASAVPPGFPHEMLASDATHARVTGGRWHEIDGADRVVA
jgi:aryl-alcohol dehydrogenase-like predicted oxidoreductase